MRKFRARWWVSNPRERFEREVAALAGSSASVGVSVRFIREAAPENVRYHLAAWYLAADGGLWSSDGNAVVLHSSLVTPAAGAAVLRFGLLWP
jgi:hypothetical protein